MQLSGKVDDCTGFEYDPQLVYARITVRDVERHHAVETARMHLDAVLAVVEVHENMWKVLDGHLFFDDTPSYLTPRWGLKKPLPEPIFYENDYFTTHLREMASEGDVITAEAARLLQPVLRLQAALTSVPRSDPEAIVMAAVRAIEHCNTWVAPLGGYRWYGFAEEYLFDEYTVTMFANRAVRDVFAAVVQYVPDHSPGAPAQPQLDAIRKDLAAPGWSLRIDRQKTLNHVAALKQIYAGHWLARQLNETDDILSSTAALSAAFDTERDRLDARVKRLTRTRNAAIHGGPLSAARVTASPTSHRESRGRRLTPSSGPTSPGSPWTPTRYANGMSTASGSRTSHTAATLRIYSGFPRSASGQPRVAVTPPLSVAPPRRRKAAEHLPPRQVETGAADEAGGEDGAKACRLPRCTLRWRGLAPADELRALVQATEHLAVVLPRDRPRLVDEFVKPLELLRRKRPGDRGYQFELVVDASETLACFRHGPPSSQSGQTNPGGGHGGGDRC